MSLNKKIVDEISALKFNNPYVIEAFVSKNHEDISYLHGLGMLSDREIENALEFAVLERARKDYEFLTRYNNRRLNECPDHLPNPEFLAYALGQGVFSRYEVEQIRFDHDETPGSFIKEYGKKDLLRELRQRLLTRPKKTINEKI